MIFSIKNNFIDSSNEITKIKIKKLARQRVLLFPTNTNEIDLNFYFRDAYKKSLKEVCLDLIRSATVEITAQEIQITFSNENADRLARLITFGNEKLFGSSILRFAFET